MNRHKRLFQFLRVLFLGVVTCLVIVSLIISKYSLDITEYRIYDDEIKSPFRIVQLSDLHGSSFGEDNSRLLQAVQDSSPDMILITGDLINYKARDPEAEVSQAESLIRHISAIAPVYVSYGNHEEAYDDLYQCHIADNYEDAGAIVLEHEYVDIAVAGQEIRLGGFFGYGVLEQDTEETHREDEALFLREYEDTDRYKILMCHMPVCWMGDSLCEWNVDCVFAGHVHGGQIQLPLIGGLYGPDQGWFPGKDYGLYKTDETHWQEVWKKTRAWAEKQVSEGAELDIFRYEERTYEDRYLVLSRGLGSTEKIPRVNNIPEIVFVDFETQ